jgi:hypothetical protein
MAAPSIPKPDAKTWYVCIENHTGDRGTYLQGARARGDHPDVQALPIWWVEETLDTDQRHAARQARLRLAYPLLDEAKGS